MCRRANLLWNGSKSSMPYIESNFATPLSLYTGKFFRIKFKNPASIGHLNLVVFNQRNNLALSREGFRLEGNGQNFTGSTDAKGVITCLNVPAGYYELKMGQGVYSVPTVNLTDEIHTVFVVAETTTGVEYPEDEELIAEDLKLLSDEEMKMLVEDSEPEETAG